MCPISPSLIFRHCKPWLLCQQTLEQFHVWCWVVAIKGEVLTRVLAFRTRLCPSSILAPFEQYVHEWHLPLIFAFYCESYSWMLLIQMVQQPCLIRTEDHWDDIIDEPMPDFWWCVKFFKSFLVQLVDENVCYNWGHWRSHCHPIMLLVMDPTVHKFRRLQTELQFYNRSNFHFCSVCVEIVWRMMTRPGSLKNFTIASHLTFWMSHCKKIEVFLDV